MEEFFAVGLVEKATENTTNQIKFDNFIVQLKPKQIITRPKKTLKKNPLCKYNDNINDLYLTLYDYLISKNIISRKLDGATFITANTTDTVNPKMISKNILETYVNSKNADYPTVLKCYIVNPVKLSNFLRTYKYNPTDEIKILGQLGGKKTIHRRKQKQKQTRRY